MKRKKRTAQHRLAIAENHNWICHLTGLKIDPVHDTWHLDHIIPLAGGGEDTDENLAPVLAWAHLQKTKADVARIAKGKRLQARHFGAKRKAKGRPMPGTKASGLRRRMDGTVERRT